VQSPTEALPREAAAPAAAAAAAVESSDQTLLILQHRGVGGDGALRAANLGVAVQVTFDSEL
jgi:hypothetical protein